MCCASSVFHAIDLHISCYFVRHHIYEKPGGPKSIDLKEVGPRFEMRLYKVIHISISHYQPCLMFEALISITIFAGANMLLVWQLKLGTMEQDEAQSEFELRPYINTAKKQRTLGAWIEWMWFGWWPTLQYSDFSLLWPFTVYCNSSINAQGNVSCIVFPNLRLFQWSL